MLENMCLKCHHIWRPRLRGRSRVCPGCHSKYWDSAESELNCLQCYHAWNPKNPEKSPKTCPKCKSTRWDEDVDKSRYKACYRCSYTWISRFNSRPVRCPKCKSNYWDQCSPPPRRGRNSRRRIGYGA